MSEWELYQQRVNAFNLKREQEEATIRMREAEQRELQRLARVEEQQELARQRKAAEYAAQTESFMEGAAMKLQEAEADGEDAEQDEEL